ncbi:MAG: hypothetical protein CL512_04835 [Actinobacteria bacterium]|nr:hypothetical protein [Actinomycetota bacterium]|tara:strand:+ start:325 stop:648 length:324 start_codon:yes stop_codon:yes gene_type:complete
MKVTFGTYDGDPIKFFYVGKKNESREAIRGKELGYLRKLYEGVEASLFFNGAWSDEICIGTFASTSEAQKEIIRLFRDESLIQDLIRERMNDWMDRVAVAFAVDESK